MSKLAHQAGIPHCSLVTASISNPNSWFQYARMKGQVEAAAQEVFPRTSAFRAGQLNREEDNRLIERIGCKCTFKISNLTLIDVVQYYYVTVNPPPEFFFFNRLSNQPPGILHSCELKQGVRTFKLNKKIWGEPCIITLAPLYEIFTNVNYKTIALLVLCINSTII